MPEGQEGDTANDSAHCRLYHANAAAEEPALHCPHAGPDGGGVCTACGPCDSAGMVCDAGTGTCVCVPEAEAFCVDDEPGSELVWLDSCGAQGEVIAVCEYGCEEGACLPCIPNPDCGEID